MPSITSYIPDPTISYTNQDTLVSFYPGITVPDQALILFVTDTTIYILLEPKIFKQMFKLLSLLHKAPENPSVN